MATTTTSKFNKASVEAKRCLRSLGDALPQTARAYVERIATRKIQGFLGTIDEHGTYLDPVYKQTKRISQQIIADYHGRFLIELVQNAHDAHDKDRRNGEILIRLASDEGVNGTLYVANRGRPFNAQNVDALCGIGLSSKPPGEAVGNKGLGFRSVRHVTDGPQVFSRGAENSPGDAFDGFCFTFARGVELDPLLPDEKTRALARSDLPEFSIPRWIDQVPDTVADLAAQGFSTVIRLPLRSEAALVAARDELVGLAGTGAPMLLFLRRIASIAVVLEGDRLADDCFSMTLTRDERLLAGKTGPALVDLGSNGRFWLARAEIPEADMQQAIADGLESGALPESWEGWKGPGEVALAVPVDKEEGGFSPRLYTFLPMGRGATSPFRGHLHGSFFPSSNRTSLDPAIKLNALVLDHAVQLACETAFWLEKRASPAAEAAVPSDIAARAAVDMLIWSTPDSLLQSDEQPGDEGDDDDTSGSLDLGKATASAIAHRWSVSSLPEATFVPCLDAWDGDPLRRPPLGPLKWSAPVGARRLTAATDAFTPDVIARHGRSVGVAPLWPGLGVDRSNALVAFLSEHARWQFRERLSPEERAGIAEGLAKTLASARRKDWGAWRGFYRDLPAFMENNSDALAGRNILYCQDATLRSARTTVAAEPASEDSRPKRGRRRPIELAVFVPPRRGEAEDDIGEELYPPAPVQDLFAFLHGALPWYGALADARAFLEKKLALPFESEALLTRISQIVERDQTKRVRLAGLRWAFAIWRRSVAVKREVSLSASYRLYVPTIDGEFIPASDAIFSSAWPDRMLGYRIQQFLELAPAGLPDLDGLRARRLAPPSNAAFGTRHLDQWTVFLSGIGVQKGLRPRSLKLPKSVVAGRMRSFDFLEDIGLPSAFAPVMKNDVEAQPHCSLFLPSSTQYEITDPIWWLPGQFDVAQFSDEALDAYALLIIEWIGDVSRSQLWMEVRHHYNYRSDTRNWPTPLAAFLRSVAWVPCEEPGADVHTRRRCKGADVWLAPLERFPPFLRRPSFKLSRALDRAPETVLAQLRSNAGFKTFFEDSTLLEQAAFLADQFAGGGIRPFHQRELVNIYNRCWLRLADLHARGAMAITAESSPSRLLVRRRGNLGTVSPADNHAPVIVRDNADPIAASLADVTGDPFFDIRTAEPHKIGALMTALYGNKVRRTSELAYAVTVDGVALADIGRGGRLVDGCPWLKPMLAVALEALDQVDLNRLPADRSTLLNLLDQIDFKLATRVSFRLDDHEVSPPSSQSAFAFGRPDGSRLIVIAGADALNWPAVERALPAIAEAIQHPAIVPHLKLLARQLTLDAVPVDDRPNGTDDLLRLCRALDLGERASEAAREALGERLDGQLPWLRAIVHLAGGEDALEHWRQGELTASDDRTALLDLLRSTISHFHVAADDIVAALKLSFSIAELRARLGLDFAAFNASLVATGSAPDVDPEGQAAQLGYFIDDHRVAILDSLRTMAAPAVLRFVPEPSYAAAREALSQLTPDPDWLERFERVPEALLRDHVEAWLSAIGAPPIGDNPQNLQDLAAVRAGNSRRVRETGQAAQGLIRAWCVQRGTHPDAIWKDAAQAEAELRRRLDDAGAFDCRVWTDLEFLRWLDQLGLWPEGMEQTLDREKLGVPETEIEAAAEKARAEQERQRREARSVRVNGELRDPANVDWLKLSEEIAEALPRSVLSRPIGSFTGLAPAIGQAKNRKATGRKKSGGAYVGIPQEKKDMIGQLGELVVYHWLRARQPGQDVDRCWVSGNATSFTGRPGNDSLGHDFCIRFNKQTWYIEVKASTEDPCQFEMGESEVRCARDIARSRSAERYVIAYVANVGTSRATRIDVLPNPLGPEADGVLNIAGNSIRYNFERL